MGLRSIFRAILRRERQFKINERVAAETYCNDDRGEVTIVDATIVASAAGTLEAALVMSETLPPGESMTLTFSVDEINHFVCYMRQLDHMYRDQADFIKRHIKPSEAPGEFQTSEEAAQVSPERYAELTGESYGDTPQRRAREFLENGARHLSMAERELRSGDAS